MFSTPAQIEAEATARLRRRGGLILLNDDYTAARANLFLSTHYERFVDLDLGGPKKLLLGRHAPKVCRYCQKSAPETTFRQEAHAIPECLGNRRLISLDECDLCNQRFSQTFEHHFDGFTRPMRTAFAVQGKNGVPGFKSPDSKARVALNKSKKNFSVTEEERGAIMAVDEGGNAFVMKMQSQPHVPLEVYRCLVKMAFAVLPDDELAKSDRLRRWLIQDLLPPAPLLASLAFSYVAFLPTALAAPRVTLWRRKRAGIPSPYVLAAVGFSQCGFMYALPLSPDDLHLVPGRFVVPTFDLTLTPAFANAVWRRIALASPAMEATLEHRIRISYDSMEEVICEEPGGNPFPE